MLYICAAVYLFIVIGMAGITWTWGGEPFTGLPKLFICSFWFLTLTCFILMGWVKILTGK